MTADTATPEAPTEEHIPEGYMQNASGHLVPKQQVREHDLLRDQTAKVLAAEAERLHSQLKVFKEQALSDIADLVSVAAERYGVTIGGEKGNVTITTYDGRYRVERATAERLAFTEEVHAAKELIDDCIQRWSEGANAHLRTLVDRAFRTDKQGQIKTSAVLELLRLEIDDDGWQRAMEALRDSIQSTGTAVYVRVYRRDASGRYQAIPLDLASV
ncbi:MAG: DUF3164 family protein [Thiohalospira sp.]